MVVSTLVGTAETPPLPHPAAAVGIRLMPTLCFLWLDHLHLILPNELGEGQGGGMPFSPQQKQPADA